MGTPASSLLVQAVRAAPRRFLLPDLPADAAAARALGAEAALAWAVEQARCAPSADVRAVFLGALAAVVRHAMTRQGGLPDVQAAVLRAHDPEVDAWQRLVDTAAADKRAVRQAVNAAAHPGKTQRLPPGPQRERLERLHRLARDECWTELQPELELPALQRLAGGQALGALPGVQRYRMLRAQHGPAARSDAAAGRGRAAGAAGADAERDVVSAFEAISRRLDALDAAPSRHRVVQGLLPPRDLPGAAPQAKDEWDVALLRREHGGDAHELLLLAEVKASPGAAATDLPRLLRGLRRLAGAAADRSWTFRSAQGEVAIVGASLQRLQAPAHTLPPHVIYACTAAPESQPPWLNPAARGQLLAEPASLAFAGQIAQGHEPPDEALAPAWQALLSSPRLRGVLHQWPTAQAARAAMLHPQDLRAALDAPLPPREGAALSTPRS